MLVNGVFRDGDTNEVHLRSLSCSRRSKPDTQYCGGLVVAEIAPRSYHFWLKAFTPPEKMMGKSPTKTPQGTLEYPRFYNYHYYQKKKSYFKYSRYTQCHCFRSLERGDHRNFTSVFNSTRVCNTSLYLLKLLLVPCWLTKPLLIIFFSAASYQKLFKPV